jgi:ABC-type dipeptide/oligopeptide/nickel transport system permease subunit
MKSEKEEFKLTNLPPEANDASISKDDFKLVQADATIHDQKFETKPTTFLKDCIKRFRKNKSSVVAAIILGILLVMSIFVPIIFKTSEVHNTSTSHPELYYLEPKLFNGGGFWDGTKKMTDVVAVNEDGVWGPDYNQFNRNAVSDIHVSEEQYTTTANKYAKEGYVQFGYFANIDKETEYVSYGTQGKLETFAFYAGLKVTTFDVYDIEKLKASNEKTKDFPSGYTDAKCALFFTFDQVVEDAEGSSVEHFAVQLTEYQKAHNVSESTEPIDVKAKFDDFMGEKSYDILNPAFEVRVQNADNKKNSCVLIRSIKFKAGESMDGEYADFFEKNSFKDGNEVISRTSDEAGYWANNSKVSISKATNYLVKAVLCSFTYDTYEAALGKADIKMSMTSLKKLRDDGIIKYTIATEYDTEKGEWYVKDDGVSVDTFQCKILEGQEDVCPLTKPFTAKDVEINETTGLPENVTCEVYRYKMAPYNEAKMPKFLLGTDISGRDMFIYVFEGLRTSLLLGLVTAAICFIFGLAWGAVAGYFGGNVDLIMERFTDILAGVPWIVVMTLTIIKLGSTFFTFALALCLTGWIGTAATTRTQFYRFRGREYVLASRTLGASHVRLITKHILPNAMGTIITSAVLMVPSIIFSEATISYLGLGFKNLASLGVILSDNQVELTNHPYLLIFPAVIIALLMISFNLFGNGLRDAVNPSLKGEGE